MNFFWGKVLECLKIIDFFVESANSTRVYCYIPEAKIMIQPMGCQWQRNYHQDGRGFFSF